MYNRLQIMNLNSKQKNFRILWLFLTAIYYLGLALLCQDFFPLRSMSSALTLEMENFFELFGKCVLGLLGFTFSYYFAYREYGIYWLRLSLPPAFLVIYLILQKMSLEGVSYLDLSAVLFVIFWIIKTLKMKNLNSRLQIESIKLSKEYQEAIPLFANISSVEELDRVFGTHLRSKERSFHDEEAIVKAYEDRKSAIKGY